jgi:hypothetical protein
MGIKQKKIKFQKLRSVAMATISPKTWSWRGHSSGQNILFFQVIKIELVVNDSFQDKIIMVSCDKQ